MEGVTSFVPPCWSAVRAVRDLITRSEDSSTPLHACENEFL
jgi:hypothetical protein